jgi:1-acyl-sn-glycerol-3-phosphate acyltransferase
MSVDETAATTGDLAGTGPAGQTGTGPAGHPGAVTPARRGFPDRHPWYLFSRMVVAGSLRLVADVHVSGMEQCPAHGGLILASNHSHLTDIPLIAAWCRRAVIYFTKWEIRDWPVIGGIGLHYGQIFVRRGEADRRAIREALTCLAAGEVLGVFPEGHRSHGRGLLPGKPGIGLLAVRSGVPVWPVAVTGTESIGRRLRPRVTLTGGPPFDPVAAARAEHGPSPSYQDITDVIMRRIAALLPEDLRGAYR